VLFFSLFCYFRYFFPLPLRKRLNGAIFGIFCYFFGLFFRWSSSSENFSTDTLGYIGQETAKGPFRSSSQAVTCNYQSNHLKVETIPLSALPKDTTSELAGLSYYPFNAERQAVKL